MKEKIKKFAQEYRYLLKPVWVLSAIYLVAFSAIILAGVHYADDVARTNFGYPGWAAFGRYLSTGLSLGLYADSYLTNIAPLPQFLAIILLAVASVIVICLVSGKEIFKEKWTKWIWQVVAVTPLVLCPYFLACFSYQYDAPYMALSILFAVAPFCFRRRGWRWFVPAVLLGVLGVCMTYQPSLGILMILAIFLTIKDWNSEKSGIKEPLKRLAIAAVTTGVTAVVFEKYLTIERDIYVSTSTIEADRFIPEFFQHISKYFQLVRGDFRTVWLILMALIAVGFVIMFVIKSKQNKLMAGVVATVSLVLMAVAIYAPYAALARPLWAARAMYAIGAPVAVLGVYIVSGKGWQKIMLMPVGVLSWCFLVFALTYGNALKEQNKFRNMQMEMVVSDLNEILPEMSEGVKIIQTRGQADFAPQIRHMPESRYRLIYRLLMPTFGKDEGWMAYRVTHTSGLRLVNQADAVLCENKLETLKATEFYIIKGCDEGILVEFTGEEINF